MVKFSVEVYIPPPLINTLGRHNESRINNGVLVGSTALIMIKSVFQELYKLANFRTRARSKDEKTGFEVGM